MVTKAATTVVHLTTTHLPTCTSRQTLSSKVKRVICTSLLELAQVLAKFRSSQVTRQVARSE
jgi:hypothetical protein